MEINGEDDGNVTDSSFYTCTEDDEIALREQYKQVLDYTTQAETSVAGSDETDSDESNVVSKTRDRARRSSRSSSTSSKHLRKTKHYISLKAITDLFGYLVPYIKHWEKLAYYLGFTNKEIDHIKKSHPHQRNSDYASYLLWKWKEKERSKATKSKLDEALTKLGWIKALEAIKDFRIMDQTLTKSKTKMNFKRNKSHEEEFDGSDIEVEPKNGIIHSHIEVPPPPEPVPDENEPPQTTGTNHTKTINNYLRKPGEMTSHCHIQALDHTQLARLQEETFLRMAEQVMNYILQKGGEITQALNSVERLRGIICRGIFPGSILVVFYCPTLMGLDRLWDMHQENDLKKLLEGTFFTKELLDEFQLKGARLKVTMNENEFNACRKELKAMQPRNTRKPKTPPPLEEIKKPSPPERVYPSKLLLDRLEENSLNLSESLKDFLLVLSTFQSNTSNFLLLLQQIHPQHLQKVSTLQEFYQFEELCTSAEKNPAYIKQYLKLYKSITDKFYPVVCKIKKTLQEIPMCYDLPQQLDSRERIISSVEKLTKVMKDTYDFSKLDHPNVPSLALMEKLQYNGLVSFLPYMTDKVRTVEAHIWIYLQGWDRKPPKNGSSSESSNGTSSPAFNEKQ